MVLKMPGKAAWACIREDELVELRAIECLEFSQQQLVGELAACLPRCKGSLEGAAYLLDALLQTGPKVSFARIQDFIGFGSIREC
jgi:hypothetical protein